jgi:hypothetical protein
MAEQFTPEEIAEIFEQYKKSQKSLEDAQVDFGRSLGRSALQLGNSLYKGEKGVGQFGDAVEDAAGAIGALLLVLAPFSIAAKAAAVALTVFAKGVNMAAKQGDQLFKTYQDLSRAGATASDGITGVFRNMQNLGYGIEELDKMVQLVSQNAGALAKFSLTAADGTNAFAEGMARIQRDGQLRDLGKTTDDINSAGAAFIRQQVMLGRRQGDIQGQVGDRTRAYILELDRLQRLTGTSADALQKQQEEMLSEDAFNVYMEMLQSQGEAGKAQIQKIKDVSAMLPAEYQKLVAQSIGGNVEAQQKLLFIAPNLIKDLQDPIKNTADTTKTLNQDLKNFKGVFAKNYLLDPTMREFGGRVIDLNETIAQTSDYDKRAQAAERNTKIQDTATKALSEAQIANMNSRDAMQAFIQKGVAPATVALSKMAQAAGVATGAAAGAAGAPGGGAATGGEGRGPSLMKRIGSALGIGEANLGDLRVKSPEAYGGGDTSQQMINIAKQIQDKLGGDLRYFSAFNDTYDRGGNSLHGQGRALDFTLTDPSKASAVADMIRGIPGISKVLDEYANPSRSATGGHIHAEISAANGAILSGPMSGYRPNLTMHGTEAIVPLNTPGTQSMFGTSDSSDMLARQLDKLDEIVRVMQTQVSVSNKILQAAN